MVNKKNILICLMAGLMMFACMMGCAGKEENEKEAAGWRKQAEKLAVLHVEEKYGFTPTVVESKSNLSDSVVPVSRYIPQTVVTMSDEDRTFYVVADGEDTTTENVLDNYQAEELSDAFKDYLSDYLQMPVYDVCLEGGISVTVPGTDFHMEHNFFNKYFDGANLEEILTNNSLRAYVKMVGDINLDEVAMVPKDSWIFHSTTEILITTHEDEKDADKCSLGSYFEKTVYTHAMYISDALEICRGEIAEYDLSVGQCGDIYYLCSDMETSEFTLEIAEDTVDILNWEYELFRYQRTGEDAYFVSGNFTDTNPELYVYYPKELLPEKPDGVTGYRMGVAYRDTAYDKNDYEWYAGTEIEGYIVYRLSMKNKDHVSLRLLFETDENTY